MRLDNHQLVLAIALGLVESLVCFIQQLCTTLEVADADELVPSVQQLIALCEHAGAAVGAAFDAPDAAPPR